MHHFFNDIFLGKSSKTSIKRFYYLWNINVKKDLIFAELLTIISEAEREELLNFFRERKYEDAKSIIIKLIHEYKNRLTFLKAA